MGYRPQGETSGAYVEGEEVRVCGWLHGVASGPWPCLADGLSQALWGGAWKGSNLIPAALRGPAAGPAAGASSKPVALHLQVSAGREKR